jgi:hypothetical protein
MPAPAVDQAALQEKGACRPCQLFDFPDTIGAAKQKLAYLSYVARCLTK